MMIDFKSVFKTGICSKRVKGGNKYCITEIGKTAISPRSVAISWFVSLILKPRV